MENVSPVRAGPSRHDMGLFAVVSFAEEQEIVRVTGQVIDDPDYSSDYCMDLGGPYSLEPGEPYRFLNHSCDPNCELLLIDVEDEDGRLLLPEIWLSALRDIEPGEELTIDYGWPAEQGIRCTCGSANCRGWIAAETEPLPETPEPAVPTVQNAG